MTLAPLCQVRPSAASFSSASMSLARPVSVSVPELSPEIVTGWLPAALAVALVFTSAPPMPRVPDGAVMVTVTGVPKAADSVSCTTILPPIKLA